MIEGYFSVSAINGMQEMHFPGRFVVKAHYDYNEHGEFVLVTHVYLDEKDGGLSSLTLDLIDNAPHLMVGIEAGYISTVPVKDGLIRKFDRHHQRGKFTKAAAIADKIFTAYSIQSDEILAIKREIGQDETENN